jgi:ELP3 family radical SAM enzyme/protein acetyltransferase
MAKCQSNVIDLEEIYQNQNQNDKYNEIMKDKKKVLIIENAITKAYKIFTTNWKNTEYDINTIRKEKFITNINRLGMGKVYVIYIYRKMVLENKIPDDPEFLSIIQKKPIRNTSGVNAFAILLPPFPDGQEFSCKHNCHYCPNETIENGAEHDMPRSYISEEPAVARGLRNGWDAIKQLRTRLNALIAQGHTLGKLDLILEGGTYTEYPMDFLERFHRDLFYCANTYFDFEPKREPLTIEEEIKINMTTKVQIIGICIETRPDAIDNQWIRFFRKVGVTRIQLGVQHTNNQILKWVNRGHTFEDACIAVDLLKNNCFKIDIHLMPDLPYSTPEDDIKMFNTVFLTDVIQPDQVKIYPCQITPYTQIKKWYDTGRYTPYFETDYEKFLDVIQHAMTIVPAWVRLPRVVRDIPASFIEGGNNKTNLRQIIENRIIAKGEYSNDIRYREIGRHPEYMKEEPILMIREYRSGSGTEYFISFESANKKVIFGFIRLRIPDKETHTPVFPTLKNRGLVRELHVYNTLVAVGDKAGTQSSQHKGLGKRLVLEAERISKMNGMDGIAVITGEGVRSYYHKLGYYDDETFVVKDFKTELSEWVNELFEIFLLGLIFICIFLNSMILYNKFLVLTFV